MSIPILAILLAILALADLAEVFFFGDAITSAAACLGPNEPRGNQSCQPTSLVASPDISKDGRTEPRMAPTGKDAA